MNQTPNYNLSQWEATDRVQRTDFNADNAKIDSALKAESDARSAQVSVLNAALNRKGNCRISSIFYTGNDGQGKVLTFPWPPLAVVVFDLSSYIYLLIGRGGKSAVTPGSTPGSYLAAWSGNTVTITGPSGGAAFNHRGVSYLAIALSAADE